MESSTTQQYCLRWNNHRSNLVLVFEHLFQTEAFTDVTLACDGVSIKCHKMVLAACSSYFQRLFMENTCRHPIVILKGIRESDIRAILEYMYKGEVNIAQDQVTGLLKAAETLKVKGLVEDNYERTAPCTPAATLPTTQQQLQPPTISSSSQYLQEHFYSSSSASGNHAAMPIATSYNSGNVTPDNGKVNDKESIFHAKFNSHDPYHYETGATPPERILNTVPFPVPVCVWPNNLNLSPKNCNRNDNGSSSIVTANSNGGNVNGNGTSFESGLLLPNDQLKSRFTTAASPPLLSVITNKDTPTPTLRTVLGHRGGSSQPLNFIDRPPTVLHYLCPTPTVTSPLTTNVPINKSEELRMDREIEQERDRERHQDSPMEFVMDDAARSVQFGSVEGCANSAHDNNHFFGLENGDKQAGLALCVPPQQPEWKRYKQYTRNDVLAAIDAVREGMSALQAARKFGVPSRTLYDKVKKLGITTNRLYRKESFPNAQYHYQGFSYNDVFGCDPYPHSENGTVN